MSLWSGRIFAGLLLANDGFGDHFDSLDRQFDPIQLGPKRLDGLVETLDIHTRSIGRSVPRLQAPSAKGGVGR